MTIQKRFITTVNGIVFVSDSEMILCLMVQHSFPEPPAMLVIEETDLLIETETDAT